MVSALLTKKNLKTLPATDTMQQLHTSNSMNQHQISSSFLSSYITDMHVASFEKKNMKQKKMSISRSTDLNLY